jgi:guanylate kinase
VDQSLLIVISGPSGSGKGEAQRYILEQGLAAKIPTFTTREPRPQEVDGRDYNFVSEAEFDALVGSGEIWERVRTYESHSYGSSKQLLQTGGEPVLITELDPKGFYRTRALSSRRTVGIFILAPSSTHLDERLERRATDTDRLARLRVGLSQLDDAWSYDYALVNDDLEQFLAALDAVVRAEIVRSRSAALIRDSQGGALGD